MIRAPGSNLVLATLALNAQMLDRCHLVQAELMT
jgi:hypothetical protein